MTQQTPEIIPKRFEYLTIKEQEDRNEKLLEEAVRMCVEYAKQGTVKIDDRNQVTAEDVKEELDLSDIRLNWKNTADRTNDDDSVEWQTFEKAI